MDTHDTRIGAARTCRAYPVVLGMLARGELHLSGVRQPSSVLTPDNHLELLDLTRFKSRREIERLLAERFPKPDVQNEMRKLPSRAPVEMPAPVLNLTLEPALEHAEALEEPGSRSDPAPSFALLQAASLPSPASNPAAGDQTHPVRGQAPGIRS